MSTLDKMFSKEGHSAWDYDRKDRKMTDIKTEVDRYANNALFEAAVLNDWQNLPAADRRAHAEHYGIDADDDWIDLLNVMALEVYGRATVRPGDTPPTIEQIVVVTGTGGPHVEFEVDMDDNVTGRAIWGSDQAEKFDTLPGLFEVLLEVVDS